MPKTKSTEDRFYQNGIGNGCVPSQFCDEETDGTPVHPNEFQKCADDCRRRHSS